MGVLDRLERFFPGFAIKKLGWLLIALQVFGVIFTSTYPEQSSMLPMIPAGFLQGEYWRAITYLCVPLSQGPFWLFMALWFLYFVTETLENTLGAFKFTVYVVLSWMLSVGFSLLTGYPLLSARDFETSLFLAVAALFPTFEVSLFFILPIQMKWLGALSGIMIILQFVQGGFWDRMYLGVVYSNFLIFFGPEIWRSFHQRFLRRR